MCRTFFEAGKEVHGAPATHRQGSPSPVPVRPSFRGPQAPLHPQLQILCLVPHGSAQPASSPLTRPAEPRGFSSRRCTGDPAAHGGARCRATPMPPTFPTFIPLFASMTEQVAMRTKASEGGSGRGGEGSCGHAHQCLLTDHVALGPVFRFGPVPGISATPYEDNLRYFNVAIAGPDVRFALARANPGSAPPFSAPPPPPMASALGPRAESRRPFPPH